MPDETYRRTTRNSGKGLEKFLGELQLAVMEAVWKRQPVSVSDVLTELTQQKRDLAYTTVMTTMSRLAEKGWLISEKQGRAFFTAPYIRGRRRKRQPSARWCVPCLKISEKLQWPSS